VPQGKAWHGGLKRIESPCHDGVLDLLYSGRQEWRNQSGKAGIRGVANDSARKAKRFHFGGEAMLLPRGRPLRTPEEGR
jgi:hypothetical protein